ncbi:MAG: hypothetical protein OEV66_02870 [Spirochaetia bacterium]|nr:hypothetical protein [Spirochaetia bacterium]
MKHLQIWILAAIIAGFYCSNNINGSCESGASTNWLNSALSGGGACTDYTGCPVTYKDPKSLEGDCTLSGGSWVTGHCDKTKYPQCAWNFSFGFLGDCATICQ